ncbi:outer membrane exchange protein TraA [Archangium sp.]|uniref:outer membrane exchange protein TraA n=1 Tax=Archangium sp. TaxID=1872627 RepID=UPI002D2B3CC1|nr:outer membrane exchange protein TraA [Archangium sp.]HYO60057.1 outer membrane exchange protein TraA [Archangium sp.]
MAAVAAMLLVALAGIARAQERKPQPLLPVVIDGDPMAPSPGQPGTGLCAASKVSSSPDTNFPSDPSSFSYYFNAFMESTSGVRVTSVLRTPFDLSNNNLGSLQKLSYGDFVDAVPGCAPGGCGFYINDTITPFGTRLRGYLNVTPTMVGKPLHFGFYTDDGVTLVIYDQNAGHRVIDRTPKRGFPSWHTTNRVTFKKPGLYPVELLYAALGGDSALEMSVFVGTYPDIEHEATQFPVISLKDDGFTLMGPASFYQTDNGRPSYPDLNKCEQCNRGDANQNGNSTCGSGYYCNGAALCAPCDSSLFCGDTCSPCGASTPVCLNRNGNFTCVQCSDDSQCPNGRCDPLTNECRGCKSDAHCPKGEFCGADNECHECVTNDHCPRGQVCSDNTCQPCATNDSCAGTSCNCCPGGLKCASPSPGASPNCVECTHNADCSDGKKCDIANGRCVEQIAECNTSERCGSQCVKCPSERPYCLDGQVCVECRSDLECGAGGFCLSGECASCTTDKRCGGRCEACPGETPFCLTDGTTAGSSCVGCREDADCGPGGSCNPTTRTCATTCSVSCAEGTVCHGDTCVECFADAHCACGGTCDTALNVCSTSCDDSSDCSGVQHCSAATQQCERGRRKPGTEPQGGSFCCGTTADSTPGGLALLLLVAAFLALRPRGAA